MRVVVVRSGSGWGGVVSKYIIDTKEKVIVNLYKCFECDRDFKYFNDDALYFPLSEFPKEAYSEYAFNIDLLECFLMDCELHKENYVMFDQQIDHVYVIDEDKIRCVYDTDEHIWPKNDALCAKLIKLIELCV